MKNQDLLNLCRLNQMEDNVEEKSVSVDKKEALKAIDWKKRQIIERIKHQQS